MDDEERKCSADNIEKSTMQGMELNEEVARLRMPVGLPSRKSASTAPLLEVLRATIKDTDSCRVYEKQGFTRLMQEGETGQEKAEKLHGKGGS